MADLFVFATDSGQRHKFVLDRAARERRTEDPFGLCARFVALIRDLPSEARGVIVFSLSTGLPCIVLGKAQLE